MTSMQLTFVWLAEVKTMPPAPLPRGQHLTFVIKETCRLPLHPRLAHMVLKAKPEVQWSSQ